MASIDRPFSGLPNELIRDIFCHPSLPVSSLLVFAQTSRAYHVEVWIELLRRNTRSVDLLLLEAAREGCHLVLDLVLMGWRGKAHLSQFDWTFVDEKFTNPLVEACKHQQCDVVRVLLEHGGRQVDLWDHATSAPPNPLLTVLSIASASPVVLFRLCGLIVHSSFAASPHDEETDDDTSHTDVCDVWGLSTHPLLRACLLSFNPLPEFAAASAALSLAVSGPWGAPYGEVDVDGDGDGGGDIRPVARAIRRRSAAISVLFVRLLLCRMMVKRAKKSVLSLVGHAYSLPPDVDPALTATGREEFSYCYDFTPLPGDHFDTILRTLEYLLISRGSTPFPPLAVVRTLVISLALFESSSLLSWFAKVPSVTPSPSPLLPSVPGPPRHPLRSMVFPFRAAASFFHLNGLFALDPEHRRPVPPFSERAARFVRDLLTRGYDGGVTVFHAVCQQGEAGLLRELLLLGRWCAAREEEVKEEVEVEVEVEAQWEVEQQEVPTGTGTGRYTDSLLCGPLPSWIVDAVQRQDNDGWTALGFAVRANSVGCVGLLRGCALADSHLPMCPSSVARIVIERATEEVASVLRCARADLRERVENMEQDLERDISMCEGAAVEEGEGEGEVGADAWTEWLSGQVVL